MVVKEIPIIERMMSRESIYNHKSISISRLECGLKYQ